MEWAVLLMAYGGPDSLEDVEPYLLDVRGGRATPPELVAEIRERYASIGGKSPLLAITRAQADALESYLNQPSRADENHYRVFVGMRHWNPYIREAVADIRVAGLKNIVALCMTPFASKMSTGAYREKLESALQETGGADAVETHLVEHWYENPRFVEALANKVRAALGKFSASEQQDVQVLFSAHSLPVAIMNQGDPYADQFRHLACLVADALGFGPGRWSLCFQSAGAQNTRWLGPSLEETLQDLAKAGVKNALVAPIGFVADHVEVLFDIDTEAKEHAAQLGMRLERTESMNASPDFIQALARIVEQEIHGSKELDHHDNEQ